MQIGDRVITSRGEIGHIETMDLNPDYPIADVRMLTQRNKPSACVSMCPIANLKIVSDSVVPMPQSAAWWKEAAEFCAGIERALYEAGI